MINDADESNDANVQSNEAKSDGDPLAAVQPPEQSLGSEGDRAASSELRTDKPAAGRPGDADEKTVFWEMIGTTWDIVGTE